MIGADGMRKRRGLAALLAAAMCLSAVMPVYADEIDTATSYTDVVIGEAASDEDVPDADSVTDGPSVTDASDTENVSVTEDSDVDAGDVSVTDDPDADAVDLSDTNDADADAGYVTVTEDAAPDTDALAEDTSDTDTAPAAAVEETATADDTTADLSDGTTEDISAETDLLTDEAEYSANWYTWESSTHILYINGTIPNRPSSAGTNVSTVTALTGINASSIYSLVATGDSKAPVNASRLFYGLTNLEYADIGYMDCTETTDMSYMFGNCPKLSDLDVSHFSPYVEHTPALRTVAGMFQGCSKLKELDLRFYDVSNVNFGNGATGFFEGCTSLEYIVLPRDFQVNAYMRLINMADDMSYLGWTDKEDGYPIVSGSGSYAAIRYVSTDKAEYYRVKSWFNWNASTGVLNIYGPIPRPSSVSEKNIAELINELYKYNVSIDADKVKKITTSSGAEAPSNAYRLFASLSYLETADLRYLDVSSTTSLNRLFSGDERLTSVNMTGWNTIKITNVYNMFSLCKNLYTIDLSSFDKAKITQAGGTFYGCSSLYSLKLPAGFKITADMQLANDLEDKSGWAKSGDRYSISGRDIHAVFVAETAGTYVRVAADLKIDQTSVSIEKDSTEKLTATIYAAYTFDSTIKWSSSNTSVATVASDGTVTARSIGTATITATLVNDKKAYCTVTVIPVQVKSVKLNKTALPLNAGDTETLTASAAPDNAADKTLTWSSSDTSVASVTNDGFVTAKNAGTAVITVSAANGVKAECTVTVTVIEVSSINLDKSSLYLSTGDHEILVATIMPENASYKTLTWTSTNNSVATVSNGEVTAKSVGTAKITAKAHNGRTASCTVTVTAPSDVYFDESTDTLILKKGNINKDHVQAYSGDDRIKHVIAQSGAVFPADCSNMFSSFGAAVDMDLAAADTSNVTNMSSMFVWCSSLTSLDLSGFDTSHVTTMAEMFQGCHELTELDLASFDTSKVTSMAQMFMYDQKLEKISVTGKWNTSKVETSSYMFMECYAIKGEKGTTYTDTCYNKTYARIDGGTSAPGYLIAAVIYAESVTLSKTSVTLKLGESVTITATVLPTDTTNKTIKWTTSKKTVATVSNGKITAKGVGTATITATISNGKTAVCTIKVEPIEVTSITLSKTETTLAVGENETLSAMILPTNATYKDILWETSSPSVAEVEDGVITAKAQGTAFITASAGGKIATCIVRVVSADIPVSEITLDKTSLTLTIGGSDTLTATISPDNATDKTIIWTSTDESKAIVSSTGVVTGLSEGTTAIKATASNGKYTFCTVTVTAVSVAPTGIKLTKTTATITVGDDLELTATISPTNATDKSVTWTSSKTSVATVSDGVVTAKAAGKATITAKTVNGLTAKCTVTVKAASVEVTSVTLDKTALTLEIGKTDTLTATVLPDSASDKTVTWTSSDEGVAMVSAAGKVIGVAEGTAVITAAAGGKSATCTVTVKAAVIEPTGITLDKTALTLEPGKTVTFTATVAPDNAADKTVTWSTSDDGVAMVSAAGKVIGVAEGKATITAKTVNGKTAVCEVTVKKAEDPAPAKPTTIIKTAFGGRTVQLNCADTDADIYYQFGSSNITSACEHVKAGETIFLNEPMTGTKAAMYFKAYKNGKWSALGKWGVLNVQIAKPLITPSGKASENNFKVYTQTKDSYIIYTLDGSKPSIEEGTQKLKVKNGKIVWGTTATINVPKGKTIKAIAVRCGLVTSDVMEYTNK